MIKFTTTNIHKEIYQTLAIGYSSFENSLLFEINLTKTNEIKKKAKTLPISSP